MKKMPPYFRRDQIAGSDRRDAALITPFLHCVVAAAYPGEEGPLAKLDE
jgi:hypothetical protein